MNLKNTLLKYTVVAYDNSIFKWFVGDSVIAHFTRFVMIGTSFNALRKGAAVMNFF